MKNITVEYQGHVYYLRCEDPRDKRRLIYGDKSKNTNVDLCLDIYKISSEGSGKTVLRSNCTIQVPFKGTVFDFYIHVVENCDFIKNPFIILEVERVPLCLKIFVVDVALSQINAFKECRVLKTTLKQNCHPLVLPGPTLLWVTKESSIYLRTCFGSQDSDVTLHQNALDVLFAKSFHTTGSEHFSYVIIIKRSDALTFYLLCLSTEDGKFCKPIIIRSSLFLPEEFQNDVSSVLMSVKETIEEQIICSGNTCFKFEQVLLCNCTCISTSDKQFLVFTRGKLRYKCPVPFGNITSITQLSFFQPYEVSFLLKSATVFLLVQKSKSDYLIHVTKVWKDTAHVYFGDFFHSGKPVLLLLHDSFFPRVITNFTTDEITESQNAVKKRIFDGQEESSEFISTMVKALNKRVTEGQISLNHAEECLQDKQRVFDCAVKTMEDFTRQGQLSRCYQDTSLVDVALGFQVMLPDHPESSSTPTGLAGMHPLYLKCVSQWQTTYRDDWILGWTFQNNSSREVQDIRGILFSCDQSLEARQMVFLHPIGQHTLEPTLNESSHLAGHVGPGQLASTLVFLKIPVCSKSCQDMSIVHSWMYLGDEERIPQQMSSKVFYKVSDMTGQWKQQFETLSAVQQLMCFRVLQSETELKVKSQCSQLGDLDMMLLERGLRAPALLQPAMGPQQSAYFVFNQTECSLSGLNFNWRIHERNHADINVFCRTQNQLFLFIHWLYESLAPDTSVLPNFTVDHALFCAQMWDAMGSELEKAASALRRQLNLAKKPAAGGLRDHKVLDQTTVRWRFQEYKTFKNELTSLESVTDNILRCLYQL